MPVTKEIPSGIILIKDKLVLCEDLYDDGAKRGDMCTVTEVLEHFVHVRWASGVNTVVPRDRIHTNKDGIYGYYLERNDVKPV